MTDRDYDDNVGSSYYSSEGPGRIFDSLAREENKKRYNPTGLGTCSNCHHVCNLYYYGAFTNWCSSCIEEKFIAKFMSMVEDFKRYKIKKHKKV